jgi:hypothetical protein
VIWGGLRGKNGVSLVISTGGWRINFSDCLFTWAGVLVVAVSGHLARVEGWELSPSPPEPFHKRLGFPHTVMTGFQEAESGNLQFLKVLETVRASPSVVSHRAQIQGE